MPAIVPVKCLRTGPLTPSVWFPFWEFSDGRYMVSCEPVQLFLFSKSVFSSYLMSLGLIYVKFDAFV